LLFVAIPLTHSRHAVKRDGLITNCAFYVIDLGGKHNLSTIRNVFSRNVAPGAGGVQDTRKRSHRIYTGKTARPLVAHEMPAFFVRIRIASACKSEFRRATPRFVEEGCGAMERYRTIGINYIPLIAVN